MTAVPRPEYPRPQFVRDNWINLNGKWNFEFDFGESGFDAPAVSPAGPLAENWNGADRGVLKKAPFSNEIIVPFCPESSLSGVGYKDFIPAIFYSKEITIPQEWQGKRIILHFGGVDNVAMVYIDGKFAGRHKGGQCSFEVDITDFTEAGKTHMLVLHAIDHLRDGLSGAGKQCRFYQSYGCLYTRVTGIWATVWLEAVDMCGLKRCRIVPDLDNSSFVITPEYYALPENGKLQSDIYDGEKIVASATTSCGSGVPFVLNIPEKHPWTPDDPFLYGIKFTLFDKNGNVIDVVDSYAGLRKISIIKDRLYLNNKPFFPRFVLDQGYYPDGIWTAPSDEALENDIKLGKAAGFNGARLHQKVFEERFHYHADKLGYLTWGEYGNWGMDSAKAEARENFLTEWQEIVLRDMNHPSIIVWCPLNETCSPNPMALSARFPNMAALQAYRDHLTALGELTKSIDPGRPFSDTSGFLHVKTDLWSVHCYSKDIQDMKKRLFPENGGVMVHAPSVETGYCGQPYLCNEFGGFMYIAPERRGECNRWGYHGLDLQTPAEWAQKIREQIQFLISTPEIGGYCYTQLTDVEQEQNGIYHFDRSLKCDMAEIREIFSEKPDWSEY